MFVVVLTDKVKKCFKDRYSTSQAQRFGLCSLYRLLQLLYCRCLDSVEQCRNFFFKSGLVRLMFSSLYQESTG